MNPSKRKPKSAPQPVFTVEKDEGITLLRFSERDELAGSDVRMIDPLWEFFDSERKKPSHILAFFIPRFLLNRKSLEGLLGLRPTGVEFSQHEIRARIVREENVIQRFVKCVRELPTFVVFCINGEVAFRLMAPLLACDYRIASRETVFVNTTQDLPHAPFGVMPWFLTRMLGAAKTTELLLDTPRLSAENARDLGIVNHVTTSDPAEDAALKVIRRLASLPRSTLVGLKKAIVASCEDFETYVERESVWTQQLSDKSPE